MVSRKWSCCLYVDSPAVTADIFVNCIYLSKPIPKFITSEFMAEAGEKRRLSVIVDVSCE